MVAPAAPSPTTAPPEVRVEPPAAQAVVPEAPKAPEPAAAAVAASPLKDAFFDYDKSALREDQKAALTEDVAWLKGNAGAKVLIEGHCDERGTAEYNLGLGERRAKAVKDYLIAAGVAADRISIISYGKERPFVLGHDESAWKWNRRGHFVLQGM
jgi:peptidoglycan-associated lipoprotein